MPEDHAAWHTLSVGESLERIQTTLKGLTGAEAAHRLSSLGRNELTESAAVSPVTLLLWQFKSLIIWILIAAGVISGVPGELVDAIAILAIVVLNAARTRIRPPRLQ